MIIISLITTFTIGIKKIRENHVYSNENQKEILTVWHVDSFEGGTGSRRKFLLDVASDFEKNTNVIIAVNSYSVLEIEEKLEKGNYPDIISFSNGINVSNLKKLNVEYNAYGAKIGKDSFAVPWCRGGYVLISKNKSGIDKNVEHLIVSQSEYNFPVFALLEDGYSFNKLDFYNPKIAYQKFLSEKNAVLLGTQRDVVRISYTKLDYEAYALKNYNDLFQYVGVCSDDKEKIKTSNDFIDYLLSEKVQQKLVNLKLFSEITEINFSDEVLNEMQKLTDFLTLPVFIDKGKINEIKQTLYYDTMKFKDEYLKIKKLYVKPWKKVQNNVKWYKEKSGLFRIFW